LVPITTITLKFAECLVYAHVVFYSIQVAGGKKKDVIGFKEEALGSKNPWLHYVQQ
jgi:hypothetical protein